MKKIVLLFLIVLSINSFAQNTNNWKIYFENNQISISYKIVNCEYETIFDQELIILKINNNTEKKLNIQWEEELWYNDICINCETEKQEYRTIISIDKQEILTGGCFTDNKLRLFSKFTNTLDEMPGVTKIDKLTKFELNNITIQYE